MIFTICIYIFFFSPELKSWLGYRFKLLRFKGRIFFFFPVQTSDTVACVRYEERFQQNGVTAGQIFWPIANVEVPDFRNITSCVVIFWLWCHIVGPINGAAPANGYCALV